MGSDEPVEHWAGPESLDPTPVWKQYLVVVLLALAFLGLGAAYAYVAVLPDAVTPPAAIPGRVILAVADHPPGTTKKITLGGDPFYLGRLGDEFYAISATWSPAVGGPARCAVRLVYEAILVDGADAAKTPYVDDCTSSLFDARGAVVSGSAPRGLDRYLVSRKGDRLIVNTDHLIQGKP